MNVMFSDMNCLQRNHFLLVFLLHCLIGVGQESDGAIDRGKFIDSLYREDQFYTSITFNLIWNSPINQSGFSGGLHLGYIRDMPINKRRNIAIGLGAGYSVNTYGQSLFIGETEENEESIFVDLDDADITFNSNRFITNLIEVPIEFRWRTSVPESHKFWRVYTGIKLGYLYHFRSKFDKNGMDQVVQTEVAELNRWRIGATFAFGWNTFNFYFHYSLNPLFTNEAMVPNGMVSMNVAKFGLIFYIL